MNISLPQPLKRWVERQVHERGFATASEYVREVLRREQHVQAVRRRVDERLVASLDSGAAVEMTADDWADIRREANERSARKQRP